ncbi:hypothetical protein ACS8Y6_04400 [Salinisphaera sp. RV14]|uniref:hypothetical protein n=1 Tax=Salinisphaera sp. RV14 TaxID=3454140 RepID=UPI003F846023
MSENNFEQSVFINCPFDDDYRQLLLAIIFTAKFLGFNPRLTLERADSGATRISHIIELIAECKFGIHDLSRLLATEKNQPARMNMPFELGVDFGCKKFKEGEWQDKRILILEKERYRYQAALSDLSGSDIKNHDDDPMRLTKAVRDWFVTEVLGKGPSHKVIWYSFNDFTAALEENLIQEGHEQEDFGEVPIPEVMSYMDHWFVERV